MILPREYQWHTLIIFARVEPFHTRTDEGSLAFAHTESWCVALEYDFRRSWVSSAVSFSAQIIVSVCGNAVHCLVFFTENFSPNVSVYTLPCACTLTEYRTYMWVNACTYIDIK